LGIEKDWRGEGQGRRSLRRFPPFLCLPQITGFWRRRSGATKITMNRLLDLFFAMSTSLFMTASMA
jgi:hypothetical protein